MPHAITMPVATPVPAANVDRLMAAHESPEMRVLQNLSNKLRELDNDARSQYEAACFVKDHAKALQYAGERIGIQGALLSVNHAMRQVVDRYFKS